MKTIHRMALLPVALLVLGTIPMQDHAQENPPDRRIEIIAERFTFFPSRIRVKRGTTVEFILTSDDTYHGFFMPQFGVNTMIQPTGKDTARVRINFRDAGEFIFECSRPCGAGHTTMRGVVIVEE